MNRTPRKTSRPAIPRYSHGVRDPRAVTRHPSRSRRSHHRHQCPQNSHPRRGAALLLALWLLLLVGLLVFGMSRTTRLLTARSRGQIELVQARWLARAGLERALELLAADFTPTDDTLDLWYSDPATLQDIQLAAGFRFRVVAPPPPGAPDDAVRFGLDDEASRLSVNSYGPRAIAALPALENHDATQIAAAIADWRDRDEETRPGGAERRAYDTLTFPYPIRNAPFQTHRELMLVQGVSPDIFFGEDTNRNGLLDGHENDGPRHPPEDDADGTLNRGLAGMTTVYAYRINQTLTHAKPIKLDETNAAVLQTRFSFTPSLAEAFVEKANDADDLFDLLDTRGTGPVEEGQIGEITMDWLAPRFEEFTTEDDDILGGRVNVNTARREVLQALPQLSDSAVEKIMARRQQRQSFLRVGDLYTLGILNADDFQRAADRLTVRSNTFRLRSEGTAPGGVTVTLQAVIDRGGDRPVVLYWHESE